MSDNNTPVSDSNVLLTSLAPLLSCNMCNQATMCRTTPRLCQTAMYKCQSAMCSCWHRSLRMETVPSCYNCSQGMIRQTAIHRCQTVMCERLTARAASGIVLACTVLLQLQSGNDTSDDVKPVSDSDVSITASKSPVGLLGLYNIASMLLRGLCAPPATVHTLNTLIQHISWCTPASDP